MKTLSIIVCIIGLWIFVSLMVGCAPQYREVPQAVADELRFQEAWTSDQARRQEKAK